MVELENKVTKVIGLSKKEVRIINRKLKMNRNEWSGTVEEWQEWILHLIDYGTN